jgi:cytochrome b561
MKPVERYDRVAVVLHWIIALLMIFMVFLGEDYIKGASVTAADATVHASIGIGILVLSVLRLAWRLYNPPPRLPATVKPWEVKASKITHVLFYGMMIALPLSGWFGYAAFAARRTNVAGATFFGITDVPLLTVGNGWSWGEFHEIGGKVMFALIVWHVLAALKHQFYDRDSLLWRMT